MAAVIHERRSVIRLSALIPIAAAAMLAGCATETEKEVDLTTAPGGEGCDVTMVFGSYASGIDGKVLDSVRTWLADNPDMVAHVNETPWGREGERTLCITTTGPEAVTPVFRALRYKVPYKIGPSPITLTSKTGDSFRTERPPERPKKKGSGYSTPRGFPPNNAGPNPRPTPTGR
jgi:hypothetical protein